MDTLIGTKKKILEAALIQFAKRGYDGTSVEQIAQSVGIKAPSLYKHFKGKEDILNTIIDIAEARYEESFGSDKNTGKLPKNREEFIRMTMERIRFTVRDPMIRNIRILLVQEQFRNERFAKITTRHQLEGIQRMYGKILDGMMKEGLIKKDDPNMLAVQITAPAVVYVAEADRQPSSEGEVLEKIEKHLIHFCDVYMNE